MKKILIILISWYQKFSRIFYRQQVCVFYPSCSDYAIQAIDKYGSLKGTLLTIKRILRCHPWQKNNLDPVP